jgi:hypothetical protein
LFRPTGPIGAFGNKGLLGFMLKLYRLETLADLTLIGEIRNRFAHNPEPMTFGDDLRQEALREAYTGQACLERDSQLQVPAQTLRSGVGS